MKTKTIEGKLPLEECLFAITVHARNMRKDTSSTLANTGRIVSMRALLDLFEEYNEQLEQEDN